VGRIAGGIVLALTAGFALAPAARAQFAMPSPPSAPDGAALFRQQCGTCHTVNPADPPRQGPLLAGVFGRKAGSVPGFHYSTGFAKADFVWDEPHMDAWLTNPQSVIPGAVMLYRQNDRQVRQKIISWLKEQH
jgi:cytochrome c